MQLLRAQAGFATGAVLATVHHRWIRQAVAIGIGAWFIWALYGRLDEFSLDTVFGGLSRISALQWITAALTTALSFLAVSGYDVVIGRSLGYRYRACDLARTGFVATALAQLLGFGLVTGGLVRWRMLGASQVTLARTTILTGMITAGFFAAGTIPLAVSILISGWFSLFVTLCAYAALLIGLCCLILSIWRPRIGQRFDGRAWPKLKTIVGLVGLASADTGLAALTFYILVPPELSLPLATILPVFLFALAAGMLSGTPGGVGPFEVTIFAMLPMYSQDPLMTAIVGFRLIYYIFPGVLAAAYFLARQAFGNDPIEVKSNIVNVERNAELPASLMHLVKIATRSEAGLLGQDQVGIFTNPNRTAGMLAAESGNSLVALADPLGAECCRAEVLQAFQAEARSRNLSACLYKTGAETAKFAENFGFRSHRIGQEAVLDPTQFSPTGAAYRELRRKLAHSLKAGVTIECPPTDQLPMDEMTSVSERWVNRHGGERGFSMARFDPLFLPRYRTYLARHEGQIVGFLCVWQGTTAHGLDMMRLLPNAPDGVMQKLVCAAITAAAKLDIQRFSLAAVPFYGLDKPRSLTEVCANLFFARCPKWHDAHGLFRLKNSFRPEWQPMFLCLPRGSTGLTAWVDIHRLVRPQKNAQKVGRGPGT